MQKVTCISTEVENMNAFDEGKKNLKAGTTI